MSGSWKTNRLTAMANVPLRMSAPRSTPCLCDRFVVTSARYGLWPSSVPCAAMGILGDHLADYAQKATPMAALRHE